LAASPRRSLKQFHGNSLVVRIGCKQRASAHWSECAFVPGFRGPAVRPGCPKGRPHWQVQRIGNKPCAS
jgi:hypothetical protein